MVNGEFQATIKQTNQVVDQTCDQLPSVKLSILP